MRHWCAIAGLIRSKHETGNYDCFTVKNWLGHERMATTEGYIKHAEKYYRSLPVDWISCALKPTQNMAGMHKKNNEAKIQQIPFLRPVETIPSCKPERAGRHLNSPTGEKNRNRIQNKHLLIFQAIKSISLKSFFFSFFELVRISFYHCFWRCYSGNYA